MLVIGFAGGSGSGKTLASGFFLKFNIPSIDTDAVYRDMTGVGGKCIEPLRTEFGDSVINEEGALNRAALSEIVFSSAKKRERLNYITHSIILGEVRDIIKRMRKDGVAAVLVDAPLLFESGFDKECDLIVSVIADKNVRISRITKRDGISSEKAILRINSQYSDDFLIQKSDFIIVNNGTLENLEFQVSEIAKKILVKR